MTAEPTAYRRIELLDGAHWVSGTRVPVILVVNLLKNGLDASDIKAMWPKVTDEALEEIVALTQTDMAQLNEEDVSEWDAPILSGSIQPMIYAQTTAP